MHAAAPAALWAAWDECTCAGAALLETFLSELRVLAALLLCVCAFDSPLRSRKPAFATWGGSALQRRGPSPGGLSLLGFSGPAAPCALLTTRYGKLRTRAWPAPAYNGLTPRLARAISGLGWLAWFLRTCPPPPITLPPFASADELVERAECSDTGIGESLYLIANALSLIFFTGKPTAPLLGGGRGARREARRKSERVDLNRCMGPVTLLQKSSLSALVGRRTAISGRGHRR